MVSITLSFYQNKIQNSCNIYLTIVRSSNMVFTETSVFTPAGVTFGFPCKESDFKHIHLAQTASTEIHSSYEQHPWTT